MTVILAPGGSILPAPERTPEQELIVGCVLESAGGTINLLSGTYEIGEPSTGLTGGDSEHEQDLLPGVDGSFVVGADTDRAGLTFAPLYPLLTVGVSASSSLTVMAAVREMKRVLSSRRYGPATLRMTRADGMVRSLLVRHQPAMGDFDRDLALDYGRVLVRLFAPSPFWRGTTGSAGPWSVGGEGGGTTPITTPFYAAVSRALGEANPAVIGGDEITYPTLTVTAPFDAVEITRGDGRGYTLTAPDTVTSGTLTIRHDPTSVLGAKQVEGPDGSNWARYLSDGADLFELRPGSESLLVDVSGGAEGTTARLEWPTLYWSAV